MAPNLLENARRVMKGPFNFIESNNITDLDHEERHKNLLHFYQELHRKQRGSCVIIAPFMMYPEEIRQTTTDKKNQLFRPSIYGYVNNRVSDVQYVVFEIGGLTPRTVSVPRKTSSNLDGVVGVSAPPNTGIVSTLNIPFKPTRKGAFDRDLVWVSTGSKPTFSFGLETNRLSVPELIVNHVRAYNAALHKVQEILDYKLQS